ncbi:MAG: hypothetical protein JO215_15145, partial [Ktedonobacteraceae bacterium]|nr:hypothetical protein [Ktedonobacteraceae bacterium]
TLDIIVQGDNYTLYINGMKQGDIQSPTYSDGSLGLAVDAGTTVSFKNMVIYAL